MKKFISSIFIICLFLGISQDLSAGKKKARSGDDVPGFKGEEKKKPLKKTKISDEKAEFLELCSKAREDDVALNLLLSEVEEKGFGILRNIPVKRDARLFQAICLKERVGCDPTPEDRARAIAIFKSLALETGDPVAMYHLGVWCLNELGSLHGYETIQNGYRWVRASLSKGHLKAITPLINCLDNGYGCALTTVNQKEAKELIQALNTFGGLASVKEILTKYDDFRLKKSGLIVEEKKDIDEKFGVSFASRMREGVYTVELLKVGHLFPSEDLAEGILLLSETFSDIPEKDFSSIIQTLEGLDQGLRLQRLKEMKPYLMFLKTAITRVVFLKAISKFPKEELIHLSCFLSEILPKRNILMVEPFLKSLDSRKEADRMTELLIALPYLKDLNSWADIGLMFTAVSELTVDERTSLTIYDIYKLLNYRTLAKRKTELKKIIKTPVEKRSHL